MGSQPAQTGSMKTIDLTAQARRSYGAVLGPEAMPEDFRLLRCEGQAHLLPALGKMEVLNLVLDAASGFGTRLRRWRKLRKLMRFLESNGQQVKTVGVFGSTTAPEVLCSLQRNVLRYAYGVTFRVNDSPLRNLLKRWFANLPGGLIWSGPLILQAAPPSPVDASAMPGPSLTLLSADRQVSFLFRESQKWPYAVRKMGEPIELQRELAKHRRVHQVLGEMVPAVMGEQLTGKPASVYLEYIPEFTLTNRVAQHPLARERAFVHEASGLLEFCILIQQRFFQASPQLPVPVSSTEVADLQQGIGDLLSGCSAANTIISTLELTIGTALPRILQHGDFCVRNVLMAKGRRGRVLIDWEDLQEGRLPLVDYALLKFSLQKVAASWFSQPCRSLLSDELAATEAALGELLELDRNAMRVAELLSLASLCRQNLQKGRSETAQEIFTDFCQRVDDGSSADEERRYS